MGCDRLSHNCCLHQCMETLSFNADGTPFEEFETVEGTQNTGGGTPYHLEMTSGQVLEHGDTTFHSTMEAWQHRIRVTKDSEVDIDWAGGTISFRFADGTVSVDDTDSGNVYTSDFMPSDEGTINETYLSLYVTKDWYAVCVEVFHDLELTPGNLSSWSTRGSIQCVDRESVLAEQWAKLTAGSNGAGVYEWTISDHTVSVEGGYYDGTVTQHCGFPKFPAGSEATHQDHNDGTYTSTNPDNTTNIPDELVLVGDVSGWHAVIEDSECVYRFNGVFPSSGLFSSGVSGSDGNIEWRDYVEGDWSGDNLGPDNVMRGSVSGWYETDSGHRRQSESLGCSLYMTIPNPTAAEPYPKFAKRFELSLFNDENNAIVITDVPIDENGEAAATLLMENAGRDAFCPQSPASSSDGITDASAQWSPL